MRDDTNQNKPASDVEREVRSLEHMKLPALCEVWRQNWGEPPALRSAQLLRLIIAWRIQAAIEGGLQPDVRARIRSSAMPRIPNPPAGTRLTREYRGVLYTVEIGNDAIRHAGHTYRSLSAVASAITGTHWNGPRFFGLRTGSSS